MIDAINPTAYQEHIQKTHEAISQVQWSDQYELKIKMIAPSTKQLIPIELIKSYSFKYKAFNTEKISIGTKSVRYFNEVMHLNKCYKVLYQGSHAVDTGFDFYFLSPLLLTTKTTVGSLYNGGFKP
jgi:hypothetical protein